MGVLLRGEGNGEAHPSNARKGDPGGGVKARAAVAGGGPAVRGGGGSGAGGRGDAVVVAEEEGGGSEALARIGSAVSTRSCQCRRHQCGKKAVVAPSEVAGDGDAGGASVAADKSSNQLAGLVKLFL